MNVAIQQTPVHRTHDGHLATYAVCRDLITAKRVAMLQVLHIDGGQRYRSVDCQPMPEHFAFDDAIRFAMNEQRRLVEDHIPQAA